MVERRDPQHLSDDALVTRLDGLVGTYRETTAELLAHIAEMDARKLFRLHACSSMFAYATTRLRLAESTAYKHIHVGRLARRFPVILEMFEAGEVHLSSLLLLAPRLTDENHQALLAEVRNKTKRQVEGLLAERFPKPPVPEAIRKLPAPRAQTGSEDATSADAATPAPDAGKAAALPLRSSTPPPVPNSPSKIEPLAPARFKVEFTADQALVDNIDKAKALLGPRAAGRELNALFALALERLVEDLEKKKFAKTARPREASSKPKPAAGAKRSRHIPNAVKREVVSRDDAQCTYVDDSGNRCPGRWGLEFDHHEVPYARWGEHTTANVRLLCKPHNQLMAEQVFGAETIAAKRARASGKGAAAPAPPEGSAATLRASHTAPPGPNET